jgi:3-oxoacyl-[acyl-carrier protein] reductase
LNSFLGLKKEVRKMIDTNLKNKVAIVTGANHGIGAATAIAFAKEGAKVFINYYREWIKDLLQVTEEEAANATQPGPAYFYKMQMKTDDEVVKKINDIGGQCYAWEADLSIADNVTELFDKAEAQFGRVDVVVNNAAYCVPDTFVPREELPDNPVFLDEYPLTTITPAMHDAHFAVNSRAVALMMAEFAKRCIARKGSYGRIINISTDGAYYHPAAVSYGASKLAMESYTRAAAAELGPYGITVNVISPGPVQTGYMAPQIEKQVETIPLRRIGRPEDIANAVVFVASDKADWITGQVIQVGGGHKM